MALLDAQLDGSVGLLREVDRHKRRTRQYGKTRLEFIYGDGHRKGLKFMDEITLRPGTPLDEVAEQVCQWVRAVLNQDFQSPPKGQTLLSMELCGRDKELLACKLSRINEVVDVDTKDDTR